MRFMLLMLPRGYGRAARGAMPEPDAVRRMAIYNRQLQHAGVLLGADGLHPPSMGARVSFGQGREAVVEQPPNADTDVLGGYWMLEVGSLEEATEWARRCPASPDEIIEVRQVQELADFPAAIRAEADVGQLP